MLTANTDNEFMAASYRAGANRFIAKPFTAAVLLDALQGVTSVNSAPAPGRATPLLRAS